MITLQSIMNFEKGQMVEFQSAQFKRVGEVKHVDMKARKVFVYCFMSVGLKDLAPNDLKIVREAVPYGWTQEEETRFRENINLTVKQLSEMFGKSQSAVRAKKYWINKQS